MILSKKHFLFLFSAVAIFSSGMAQETKKKEKCVRQGKLIIDAYYGLPFLKTEYLNQIHDSYVAYTSIKNLNHMGAEIEYMIGDFIGFGLEYTRASILAKYTDTAPNTIAANSSYNVSIIKQWFLIKFNGHFLTTKHLDPYGNLGFGLKRTKISSDNYADQNNTNKLSFDANSFPFTLRAAVGIHYYPIKNVGLGIEVGAGGPIIQGGISIKI